MSTQLKTPPEFIETQHPAQAWADWKQRFNIYALASNLTNKPDATQVAIFLHTIGQTGIKVYNNFELTGTIKLVDVIEKFDAYYKPYKNQTHLSYLFFTYKQVEGQSVDQYIAELRTKARDCEFGDLTDRLVRDIAICGIRDGALRQKLLALPDPTLSEVITHCRSMEQSRIQTNVMTSLLPLKDAPNVMAMSTGRDRHDSYPKRRQGWGTKTKDNYKKPKQSGRKRFTGKCSRCGTTHQPRNCPAFGKVCLQCGGVNHFKIVCTRMKVSEITDELGELDLNELNENYFIGALETNINNRWDAELKINNTRMTFKIDSGSDINVISTKTLDLLNISTKLCPLNITVRAYSGHPIPIIGKIPIKLAYKDAEADTVAYVTSLDKKPLVNGIVAEQLGLIKRLYGIDEAGYGKADMLLTEFSEVFHNKLGEIKGTYSISTKPDIIPKITPSRRIPQALMTPLKLELARMERDGVIKAVTEPTDWVNALLPLQKNGRLRIILDPRELNLAIRRQHYPIPTLDSILSRVGNCTVFTVLDGKDAFWQLRLDEASSLLCTFSTPFGRYRFLRVPYGISVAPELQQMTMDSICEGLQGTTAYFDDVLIGGENIEQHNNRLAAFLTKAQDMGLKLKKEKTQLAQMKVTFMGHVISSEGIEPSGKSIATLNAVRAPTTRQELQRFLGMVSFLSRYIPNLATRTTYLRSLLKPPGILNWSEKAQSDFDSLKVLVNEAPTLAHFDLSKPLELSVDASPYGLGAVLSQGGRPIEFASATLTPAQQRYAHIEKELLAVVFGCNRFHYYTYGRNLEIETDHKPLLAILKKPFDAISPRLQRLLLKLQRYQIILKYTPGRELLIADALSRSPGTDTLTSDVDDDSLQVHMVEHGDHNTRTHGLIREAVAGDPTFVKILQHIKDGWPEHKHKLPPDLKPYYRHRHDIYTMDGLIFKSNRLLIPTSMRDQILNLIHESHQGIVASKMRAREHIFWPGITNQIETMVANCHTCQATQPHNPKEPLISIKTPKLPWSKVAVDIFHLYDKAYLLVVDYYSKFTELLALGNTTNAPSVIDALKSIFSRQGTPNELMSDNGPPFDSLALRDFAKRWNFNILTSSPTHAQANGQVERTIRTIKSQLKKCMRNNDDPYLVLLNYNSTPHDGLPSPSELLMSRKLKNTLPGHTSSYKQKLPLDTIGKIMNTRQQKQAHYYNKTTRQLHPLEINAPIYYLNRNNEWSPAIVTGKTQFPRSYLITTQNGLTLRRNRKHIRPRTNLLPFKTNLMPQLPIISQPGSRWETRSRQEPLSVTPKVIEDVGDSSQRKLVKTPIQLVSPTPKKSERLKDVAPPKPVEPDPVTTRSGRQIRMPKRYIVDYNLN